jgi:prepilin-type processing-associated H-X9-DG protein
MTEGVQAADRRPSFWRALADIIGLSLLLVWLPVFGAFIAGFVGGRRARYPMMAVGAAVLPGVLWWLFWMWAARHEFNIGPQKVMPAQLEPLGISTAIAILGGAIAGVPGRRNKLVGAFLLVIAGVWFTPAVREVWTIYRTTKVANYEPDKNVTCPEHLQKLYRATLEYASSWDDTLPPADRWMTALNDPVERKVEEEDLRCPNVAKSGPKYGYAMNAAVGGKKLSDLQDRAGTPLFYDSTDLAKDAHDNVESVPKPGRHAGSNNILYLDGQVKTVAPP